MAPLLPGVHPDSSCAHKPVIADCDLGPCMERAPCHSGERSLIRLNRAKRAFRAWGKRLLAWTTPFPLIAGARLLVTILVLVAVVAAGSSVEAASVTVTWGAPTTNADGTPLADLAEYRIYLGTVPPTCPGAAFHTVSSPTATPASGETASATVTALSAGTTYFARLTAVDFDGNESACSSSASGVAQGDLDVTPTATTSFGSVTVNGTVDRTFTVQNTSGASISGAASVGAPFRIVSGAPFSLAPGGSQTVTVRFQPTAVGSFASNVNFIAGSESVSRGVSGSGVTGGPTAPPSSPTAPPAEAGSPSVTQLVADAGGVTFAIAWAPVGGAASYGYVAAFTDGSALQQGTVTAPSLQLRMPYHVSGAATGGVVCIRSISATGQQSTDQSCAGISVPARPASAPPAPPPAPPAPTGPPPAPGAPSVTLTAADASSVTFTIAWGAVSGATSFGWVAAFNDGSAAQQGTVTSLSFQLRMPYHVSGAAFGAVVCIRSVNATGEQSTNQSCSPVSVPARPGAPPPLPPPPPPPPPQPPPEYGWGTG